VLDAVDKNFKLERKIAINDRRIVNAGTKEAKKYFDKIDKA
jgi:hypothetical protein